MARGRSGRHQWRCRVEYELFGRPPAHQHGDAIFQINTAEKETVFRRTLNSVAERPDAARNDRSLLDRIDARQGGRYQRVALMSSICHAAYRASITPGANKSALEITIPFEVGKACPLLLPRSSDPKSQAP